MCVAHHSRLALLFISSLFQAHGTSSSLRGSFKRPRPAQLWGWSRARLEGGAGSGCPWRRGADVRQGAWASRLHMRPRGGKRGGPEPETDPAAAGCCTRHHEDPGGLRWGPRQGPRRAEGGRGGHVGWKVGGMQPSSSGGLLCGTTPERTWIWGGPPPGAWPRQTTTTTVVVVVVLRGANAPPCWGWWWRN